MVHVAGVEPASLSAVVSKTTMNTSSITHANNIIEPLGYPALGHGPLARRYRHTNLIGLVRYL